MDLNFMAGLGVSKVIKCERCNNIMTKSTWSMFNQEHICMDCKETERAHPKYNEAVETERAEVIKGNLNYEGIGLPEDYKEFATMYYINNKL